jgi:hypothetical protein
VADTTNDWGSKVIVGLIVVVGLFLFFGLKLLLASLLPPPPPETASTLILHAAVSVLGIGVGIWLLRRKW